MKKTPIALVAVLALIGIVVISKRSGSGGSPVPQAEYDAGTSPGSKQIAGVPETPADLKDRENTKPGSRTASDSTPPPAVTKSSRRDTAVSPDGIRRSIIDPMASWPELPAWPEGPRVFAEVDTSSRRYVNLRPDDAGEMPRIRAEAEERIELRVNFPEGEPGEKIFVELPNGGSFADSDAKGRVFTLPENRTLSFPYITDDSRGHCNVKLRHRGHTRSLPVWVGELPATGS